MMPVAVHCPIRVVLLAGMILWPMACATGSDETAWIRVGATTKDEIVEHYGEPDLVLVSAQGESLTYLPMSRRQPIGPISVARSGPSGLVIFQSEFVVPGLGARSITEESHPRPSRQFQVVLDDRGIVEELRE